MGHLPDDGGAGRVVDVVRVRVPSKVNLFLAIRGLRDDGYHELVSIMQTVGIRDELELALAGTPVLVESVTYRLDAHTTSDDPTRYRDDAEVEQWRERGPIERYEAFLRAEGLWDDIDPEGVVTEVEEEFEAGVQAANDYPERDVDAIFEYLYDELPTYLRQQLAEFEVFLEARPDAYDYIEQRGKE